MQQIQVSQHLYICTVEQRHHSAPYLALVIYTNCNNNDHLFRTRSTYHDDNIVHIQSSVVTQTINSIL